VGEDQHSRRSANRGGNLPRRARSGGRRRRCDELRRQRRPSRGTQPPGGARGQRPRAAAAGRQLRGTRMGATRPATISRPITIWVFQRAIRRRRPTPI
jgi:hypothetical protein